MTRKERRAAEHIARKATPKLRFPEPQPVEEPVTAVAPEPDAEPKKEISAAQLAANRANALRSTGPSPRQLRQISNNALKHGLTGRVVVLPGEDADLYESRMLAYKEEFQPVALKKPNSCNPSWTSAGASAASPALNFPLSS